MLEIYPVLSDIKDQTLIRQEDYQTMYEESLSNPDGFWLKQAGRIDWQKKPTKAGNYSLSGDVSIKWYEDGVLNASENCIDRHLPEKADDVAFIWEGDEPGTQKNITYAELKDEVCKLANALKSRGVKKGDRVIIYMPMVPAACYAMLACARIGAVHSVVFAGFSPTALKDRVIDCDAKVILTADEGLRGGRKVALKKNVDEALKGIEDSVHTVLVYKRTGADIEWQDNDVWWHELVESQSPDCAPESMNAEDPLFILYTSGSTGKPKGVLHTTGGYLVYAAMTFEYSFDYKPGEIYWCTADVGWITGHSYIVYGPLAMGATSLIFEGVPNYPDYGRFWQIVEKYKVNTFYTAPTAIRSLLKQGDSFVTKYDRSSLKILGTVGEPINHEAWLWYYNVVGEQRCPVIDTWWQTETGGHMITPFPGATDLKPGSASQPYFGVEVALLDPEGKELEGAAKGNLCIKTSWPGQMRSVYGDHQRFIDTYFSAYKGYYFTGDGAKRDADGYYWITGRVDDVLNVSGHRLGTAEIESAINEHEAVAESAVVGFPHEIKGQGIYAYIIAKEGFDITPDVQAAIIAYVRKVIGPIAKLDVIQPTTGLPKTRSGKIMRRILRKIAAGETDQIGDTSTLADPEIIDQLIAQRPDQAA